MVPAGWVWALLLWLSASPLAADEWSVYRAQDVVFQFQASDSVLARVVLDDVLEGRKEIAKKFGGVPEVGMTVYLAPSESVFRELTQGRIPHWGVGCAFPDAGVVVLRKLPGDVDILLRTARHEVAHILLHKSVSGQVPVWFDEGVAMWAAQEWRLTQSAEVFYAILSEGVVPLSEMDAILSFGSSRAHLAYTESLLAVTFLLQQGGADAIGHMISDLALGTPFPIVLFRVTGWTQGRFETEWLHYVRGRFSLTAMLVAPEAIWVYMAVLFLLAYVGIRFRNRATVKRWEEEDPLEALPLRLRLQVHRWEDRS